MTMVFRSCEEKFASANLSFCEAGGRTVWPERASPLGMHRIKGCDSRPGSIGGAIHRTHGRTPSNDPAALIQGIRCS